MNEYQYILAFIGIGLEVRLFALNKKAKAIKARKGNLGPIVLETFIVLVLAMVAWLIFIYKLIPPK